MRIRVLNIAKFIPIKDINFDNDISFKIYDDLQKQYPIESLFVKPVGYIPKILTFLSSRLRQRYKVFNSQDYEEEKYGIKVFFFKCKLPFLPKLSSKSEMLIRFEYPIFKSKIENLVKTFNPDVIHAHNILPDAYIAYKLSKKFGIPYIITLRGSLGSSYSKPFIERVIKNSWCSTTPAFALYNTLKNRFKIKLVPHGLDELWFANNQLTFNKDCLRIVTTCRILEMKNIQVVFKALSTLKASGFNFTYNIIGTGPYLNQLNIIAKELCLEEHVVFHGWKSPREQIEIYAKSNIFVMLSYPETFGRVYFEAAAQGLLIIGVKNTGAYGHFDDTEAIFIDVDAQQLSEALKSIDEIKFRTMTNKSKSKVKLINTSEISKVYFNILKNTLKVTD